MTERERRAKGLPPSPAQLAIVEQFRKDAEVEMRKVAQVLAPVIEQIRAAQTPTYTYETGMFTPRPVRQSNVIERSKFDLLYNYKEKILSRVVPGVTLTSKFQGGDAKRMQLLERLIRNGGYVQTDTLRDELDCPSNEAVRKIVQGINTKVKNDLSISEKIIAGRPTFGYHINPQISVHRK